MYLLGRWVVYIGESLPMNRQRTTTAAVLAGLLLLAAPTLRADSFAPLLKQAASEGLPVDPLRSKIKEGRAKRVPAPRIRMVVQQMVGHMRTARKWLARGKRQVPPRLLVSVAQARMAGLPDQQIRSLVPTRTARTTKLTRVHRRVDSLVDLHLRGYKGGAAVRLVQRVRSADLPVLGKTVDAVRKRTGMTQVQVTATLLKRMGPGGHLGRAAGIMPPPGGGPPPGGPGPGHGSHGGGSGGPGPHPPPPPPPR